MTSPRKDVDAGLIVTLISEEDGPDFAPTHKQPFSSAVVASPGECRFTWATGRFFETLRIASSCSARLSFDVWFPGGSYAVRWFQCRFPVRNLPDPEPVGRRHRRNSVVDKRYEPTEGVDALQQYRMQVMGGRAVITLSYRGVRYYDVDYGDSYLLKVCAIELELASSTLFQRFLEYQGHRVTLALGTKYIYRANGITDDMRAWSEAVNEYSHRVEVARARSGHMDSSSALSIDDDGDSDDMYYSAPAQSTRVYCWRERDERDAPFPSVRDGRPERLAHEEARDAVEIAPILGTDAVDCGGGDDDDDESYASYDSPGTSPVRRGAALRGSYNSRVHRLRRARQYVPDTPYYANDRHHLPLQFNRSDKALAVTLFNFRFSPVRCFRLYIAWAELELESPPPSPSPRVKVPSPRPALALLTPRLLRRRQSVTLSPRQQRTGVVTKRLEYATVIVRYRSRYPDTASVDITSVEFKVMDFEKTLASASTWPRDALSQ